MKHFRCNNETAIVTTTKGKVRGYEYDKITIFKGIPYAKAKRFHQPEELDPWDNVLNCTNYGYVCPLRETEKPNAELSVPHRYWIMNEDCQNLNIWTPGCDDKKRPVAVWLHGGGYESGSAIEQAAYEGENMCQLGDIVVISVNHRLNLLGYLNLSEFGDKYENSANAGTADLVFALKWIKDNIAAFGGNPDHVTLFGQSGGGGKITTLLQTPEADGLFHAGIIMSGNVTSLLYDRAGSSKEFIEAIMKELDVTSVKELETVKYDRLADAYNKLRPEYEAKGVNVGGMPTINSHYLGSPVSVGFRKETSQIPLMIGTTYGEFPAFIMPSHDRSKLTEADAKNMIADLLGQEATDMLVPLFKEAYPERHLIDLLTLDYMFRGSDIPYIMKRAALNDCTYSYLFNHNSSLDYDHVPWHCYDIPFAFHNIEMCPSAYFDGAEELQEKYFQSYLSFIKTGNPNNPLIPEWPTCNKDEEHKMVFDDNMRVVINHDHKLIPVFEEKMKPVFEKIMEENADKTQH